MRRGEIWWVSFDPALGSEIKKTRPAVIVSNDASNRHSSRFQVIPATSAIRKLYPFECLVEILGKQSKLMADQLTTVTKSRILERIGRITDKEMKEVERIIMLQLNLVTLH